MTNNNSNDVLGSNLKPLKFLDLAIASFTSGAIVGGLVGLIVSMLSGLPHMLLLGLVWGGLGGGVFHMILGYPLHYLTINLDTKTRKIIFALVGFIIGAIIGIIIYNAFAAGTENWEY